MEEDLDPPLFIPLLQDLFHLIQRLAALLLVGGVHVKEVGLPPHPPNLLVDPLHIGQGGLAIQVDSKDMHPRSGQRQARRLAEPA